MRNLLFVLVALLIATPAMALVTITATEEPGGWVRLDYTVTGEANKMRAVALDISTDVGNIWAISGYKTGESTAADKGYGIFPGSIDLTDPLTPVWNDPIAPDTDPGAAGTGLGTNRIIVEMGSLYDKAVPTDAPLDGGMLCRVRVTNSNTTVTVAEELTYRGGIVMEDSNPPAGGTSVSGCVVAGTYTGPDTAEWAVLGNPASWSGLTQCRGDADALNEPYGWGVVPVGLDDVAILVSAFRRAWTSPAATPTVAASDFDHSDEVYGWGTVRCGLDDVDVLVANFRRAPTIALPDCQL